ncbi:MAG: hypothetical protein KA967_02245 [Methanoculleus sp.]|nr:hypothetical protein [Methanoculleus sp.]
MHGAKTGLSSKFLIEKVSRGRSLSRPCLPHLTSIPPSSTPQLSSTARKRYQNR